MAMPSGQRRRQEFSFPGGSPARGGAEHALLPRPRRGGAEHALPPRPPANPLAPRAGEEDFRWLQASRLGSPDSGSGGSGTPSPQLWAHHQHQHRLYPASVGSSPSRAQAIAGYRREMLDLVRGLPESAYELSLRDIVESPSSRPPPPRPCFFLCYGLRPAGAWDGGVGASAEGRLKPDEAITAPAPDHGVTYEPHDVKRVLAIARAGTASQRNVRICMSVS